MSKKKILSLCLVIALAATAILGGTLAYFTDVDEVNNTFTMGKVDITLDEAPVDGNDKATDGERVHANDYSSNMNPGHVFAKDPTIHVMEGSEDSYIFLDINFNKYNSLFWVMAAEASADAEIDFTIFNADGTLSENFQNENDVFSSTKFVEYMNANPNVARQIINKWFAGIEHADWLFMGYAVEGTYVTLRFAYQGDKVENKYIVDAGEDQIDIRFMTAFQIPETLTQDMINDGVTVGKMQNAFNTTNEEFHMNFIAYAIQAAELADINAAYEAMFNATPLFPAA